MHIDYDLLRTLLETANAGTFARAAAARRITPSAVSQQLRVLEGQLGVRLHERVGRRARRTPAAEALVDVLRTHLGAIDEALLAAVEDQRTVKGTVRLGSPMPFGRVWLRPRLAALMAAHPRLDLEVRFEDSASLEAQLRDGDHDVCVLMADGQTALRGIRAVPVFREELVAVASRRYLRHHGTPRSAEDFRGHRLIVFSPGSVLLTRWWQAWFGRRERLPQRLCSVANLDEMLGLAEADGGITVLPDYVAAEPLGRGAVEKLPAPRAHTLVPHNVLHVAWREGAPQTARFLAVHRALTAPQGARDLTPPRGKSRR